MKSYIRDRLNRLKEALPDDGQLNALITAGELIKNVLDKGGKILACGNGGSAADAQHIVAEFVVKYKNERKALPAVALSVDTSVLTACSNDFGFEHVFERQIEALGERGDVLIAISTSGKSKNVNLAVQKAREKGLFIIYFTGKKSPEVANLCDIVLSVNSTETPIIQEIQRFDGHMLVEIFEHTEGYL